MIPTVPVTVMEAPRRCFLKERDFANETSTRGFTSVRRAVTACCNSMCAGGIRAAEEPCGGTAGRNALAIESSLLAVEVQGSYETLGLQASRCNERGGAKASRERDEVCQVRHRNRFSTGEQLGEVTRCRGTARITRSLAERGASIIGRIPGWRDREPKPRAWPFRPVENRASPRRFPARPS